MMGLLVMAGRLANSTARLPKFSYGVFNTDSNIYDWRNLHPISRKELSSSKWQEHEWPASRQYYRILDKISRDEKPY
jgi:hypothetical protein